jgi:hypothetical protein
MTIEGIKQAGEHTMIFGRICSFMIALAGLLCVESAILAVFLMGYVKHNEGSLFITPPLFKKIIANTGHTESNMQISVAAIFSTGFIVGLSYYFNAPNVGLGLAAGCATTISITLAGAATSFAARRLAQHYGMVLVSATEPYAIPTTAYYINRELANAPVHTNSHIIIINHVPTVEILLQSIQPSNQQTTLPMATVRPIAASSGTIDIELTPRHDNLIDEAETANQFTV